MYLIVISSCFLILYRQVIKYGYNISMVRENVLNLFSDLEGFEEANNLVQQLNARKRGSYNTKPKLIEYNPYTHIKNLYSELANFLPRPLFTNEEAVFEYEGVKAWYMIYTPEHYGYSDKTYVGEQFNITEAEISGTENFTVEDRIKLHQKLIDLLKERVELNNAIKLIQQDIKGLQKKYKIKDFTLWLRKQRI